MTSRELTTWMVPGQEYRWGDIVIVNSTDDSGTQWRQKEEGDDALPLLPRGVRRLAKRKGFSEPTVTDWDQA